MSKQIVSFLVLAITSILTACGGGGGGGSQTSTPVVTPAPTFVLVSTSPANGAVGVATSGTATVVASYTNATTFSNTLKVSCNGTTFSTVATANVGATTVTFNVAYSGATAGAVCTLSGDSVAVGVGGTKTISVNVSFTMATAVLHYTDRVFALWTGAYPYVVTKTGVTYVVNKTHFAGLAPFYNCWLAEKPLADGQVLTSCQESASNNRYVLVINPVEGAVYDYTGTVPASTVWRDVQVYDPAFPTWAAKAKVADGWYFTTDTAWVLNFRDDATGQVTVVKAGTFAVDDTIKLLMSYSN